jgi:hypothetical protein
MDRSWIYHKDCFKGVIMESHIMTTPFCSESRTREQIYL